MHEYSTPTDAAASEDEAGRDTTEPGGRASALRYIRAARRAWEREQSRRQTSPGAASQTTSAAPRPAGTDLTGAAPATAWTPDVEEELDLPAEADLSPGHDPDEVPSELMLVADDLARLARTPADVHDRAWCGEILATLHSVAVLTHDIEHERDLREIMQRLGWSVPGDRWPRGTYPGMTST